VVAAHERLDCRCGDADAVAPAGAPKIWVAQVCPMLRQKIPRSRDPDPGRRPLGVSQVPGSIVRMNSWSFRSLVRRFRGRGSTPAVRRWHSVSSTREYEGCPRRYRFGYRDKRPQDRPVPVTWRFGSVVHEGLEAAYRHAMEQHDSTPTQRGVLAVAAVDASCERHGLVEDPRTRPRAVWHVTRALATDAVGLADPAHVLGVEEAFRDRLTDIDRIVGFADLVLQRRDGTGEIIDHKVIRTRATPEQLRGDFELNLYGYLARRRWPQATRIVGTIHYPTGPTTVSVPLDDVRMGAAHARLRTTAQRIVEDTQFVPQPSERCGHCPWLPSCPEGTTYLQAAAS
jgi:CRISPR/Cas system-associated exonuclease Cas4 (RecB family)